MSETIEDTGYRVVQMTRHHIGEVETLYAAVYQKPPAPGYFQKKYDTCYTGVAYAGYLAINAAEVVIGFYAVIPCFISWKGERVLAAQSADTMTHPGYRYKGLFVELSNLCFDLCRQFGIRLIFGFPNQHSLHGAIHKLHWTQAGSMDCFTIPVRTIPLHRMAQRLPILQKWYARYAGRLLHPTGSMGIENNLISEGFAGVVRDAEYLQYKNYQSRAVIRIGEALVWLKCQQGLVIGDLQLNDMSPDLLFRKLIALARRLGLPYIQLHFSRDTPAHALCAKRFPSVPSFPILCKDFGADIPAARLKFSFADIDIF